MRGDGTLSCSSCRRPLLVRKGGETYPVAGVVVLLVDVRGIAEAQCPNLICRAIWRRDPPLVTSGQTSSMMMATE